MAKKSYTPPPPSPPSPPVCKGHAANLETLKKAFKINHVCLMECYDTKTSEVVAVLCAVVFDGEEYNFTPFAIMPNENPFERLLPCDSDGGFTNPDGTIFHPPTALITPTPIKEKG